MRPGRPTSGWGEPRDLTPEPGSALLETHHDVSPDGATVVTGWLRTDDLVRSRTDLIAIDRATGARRTIATGDAWFEEPAISPDGRWVAAVRSVLGSPDAAQTVGLWLIDLHAEGDAGRPLAEGLDLWPHTPVWSPDGAALFVLADAHGETPVFRVDVATGEVIRLTASGVHTDVAVSPDGERLFALRSAIDSPAVPVMIDARTADQPPQPLRSPVEEVGPLELQGRVERVTATAADGTPIESWLVLPPTASPTTPAPLAVFIHGGPLGTWAGWTWRWNSQVFASRGYAVLMPDPALSTGYGQAFIQRGWGRWGEEPFTDLIAAVDGAVARDDVDADRYGRHGRLVRRVHGELGRRAHRPLQGDRDPRQPVGPARIPRDDGLGTDLGAGVRRPVPGCRAVRGLLAARPRGATSGLRSS
jgi:dipeptidyl aminopeptidase/acylaminoacyl peptidase